MFSARMAKDISETVKQTITDKSELHIVLSAIMVASIKGQSSIDLAIKDPDTFEALLLLNYVVARKDNTLSTVSWANGYNKINNIKMHINAVFDEVVDNLSIENVSPNEDDREYFVQSIMEYLR